MRREIKRIKEGHLVGWNEIMQGKERKGKGEENVKNLQTTKVKNLQTTKAIPSFYKVYQYVAVKLPYNHFPSLLKKHQSDNHLLLPFLPSSSQLTSGMEK